MKPEATIQDIMQKDILTIKECALYLNVSERWLREAISDPQLMIPFRRLAGKYLFDKRMVIEWFRSGCNCF